MSKAQQLYDIYNDVRTVIPSELQATGIGRYKLLQILAVIIHLEKS